MPSPPPPSAWTETFSAWIVRRARLIATLGLLLSLVSAYFSALLYRNLRTEMEELLPNTARSVVDLRHVAHRLQSTQSLAILVFSEHPEASKRFITDLSQRIDHELGDQVARVEYQIRRELRFFNEHRALYVDTTDLTAVQDYIGQRIHYEQRIRNPLQILFSRHPPVAPRFDFQRLEGKYTGRIGQYTRFKDDGYYASPDRKVRAALIYLKNLGSEISQAKRLTKRVRRIVGELNPHSYADDLTVRYTGDVEDFVEENASLISDLEFSSVVVILLVTFSMLIYFKNVWATVALVSSLFVGTLVTFGIAYFAVGYLNANSAFLGSIVMGNGINYGIIFLGRYVEERRAATEHSLAVARAVGGTATATFTAAFAAGLSYGSLILTQFRGFRQFGIIGFVGSLICWISAFTVLPAVLSLMERRDLLRGLKKPRMQSNAGKYGRFSETVAFLVTSAPKLILAVSLGAALASAYSAVRFIQSGHSLIETDMTKLRDRRSIEGGSYYLKRYLDEVFGRYLSPIVILADNRRQMRQIEANLRATQAQEGKTSLISHVYTIDDFLPRDQEKKIRLLDRIRRKLKPKILAKMAPAEERLAHELLAPTARKPIRLEDLPPLVLDRFRLVDGSIGNMVWVEPILNEEALKNGDNQYRLISDIRSAADAVQPGLPVVGTLGITVDMYQSVRRDGARATSIAFLAVTLLVAALFRRWRTIMLALFALLIGVTWMAGIVLAEGWKINFLNFIALPIAFGIGVDYGVNILQRYRSEGPGSARKAVRATGGAVTLASLTTIIGYGSLLSAGNQAFFSFGRLAILGEACTLCAAIVSLPALLQFLDERAGRRMGRPRELSKAA